MIKEKIYVKDLDKNPDELRGGRWINQEHLSNWLEKEISNIKKTQARYNTEELSGMVEMLGVINKQIKGIKIGDEKNEPRNKRRYRNSGRKKRSYQKRRK